MSILIGNWPPHINHLSQKLVKANAMLCKLRQFVVFTARSQNLNSKHRILQTKAKQIISFASFDAYTLPICKVKYNYFSRCYFSL